MANDTDPTLSIDQMTKLLKSATMSNKNIPTFNRKEVKTWLFQFEEVTSNEDDESRIRRLATVLTGDDVEWFQSVKQGADPPTTYAAWKVKFQEKFTEPLPVIIGRLRDRKQLENEDPEKYCREVVRLSKKINPAISDAELIHNLTAGVLEKYRRDIKVMKPRTTDQFIEDLKSLTVDQQPQGAVADLDKKLDKLVDVLTTHLPKAQQVDPTFSLEIAHMKSGGSQGPKSKCQLCKSYGHEADECDLHVSLKKQRRNDRDRDVDRRRDRDTERRRDPVECQFCLRIGHDASKCFKIIGYPDRGSNDRRNNGRNNRGRGGRNNNDDRGYGPSHSSPHGQVDNGVFRRFSEADAPTPNGLGRQS